MRKFKKVITTLLIGAMVFSMAACSSKTDDKEKDVTTDPKNTEATKAPAESTPVVEDELDYAYGLDTTFFSNEPISYSMMYSDHENYPYNEEWLFWKAVTEKTNVSFDLNIIARADYDDKKSLLINAGESSYIIPKTYDESAFVTGGAVVAISDWVQYMPNYMDFVATYNMEDDLKQITKEDGKYYKLPGMWAAPAGTGSEYTFVVRKDIFDAAGVDVVALEKDWNWEGFYDALAKVQAHVGGGVIWSDRWKGENLLKIIGQTYDVPAGWAAGDGMQYDAASDSFYFAAASDDHKELVTMLNKFVTAGILDPETFTQEDQVAENKFYTGETVLFGSNRSMLQTYKTKLAETLGEGNFELYSIILPKGKNNYESENSRLENGVMISQKALDELGEEEFIKMLRFVDWLWYSPEGKELVRWGVEGETFTKDGDKYILDEEITYAGLNPEAPKALNVDFGFGNGVFMYGGTVEHAASMLSPELQDFSARLSEYRDIKPLNPPIAGNEDQTEEMNLIKTPLIDFVKSATLQFITGQADLATYDAYVEDCKSNNSDLYVTMVNDIYNSTK